MRSNPLGLGRDLAIDLGGGLSAPDASCAAWFGHGYRYGPQSKAVELVAGLRVGLRPSCGGRGDRRGVRNCILSMERSGVWYRRREAV